MKSAQMRSYFWCDFPVFSPNTEKYGPEITSYQDIFHAVYVDNIGHIVRDEAYSETCQTFKIELFAKSP